MTAQPIHDEWAVVFHLEACAECGAACDQPCDDICPSLIADLECELDEADAIAEANREYDAWGWAG